MRPEPPVDRDLAGAHAEQVDRRGRPEAPEQVGAGDPPAPARLVDDDRGALELARVAQAGVDDPVLDHRRRRRAAVPEQRVEVRDVADEQLVAVGGGVAHLGDAALGRVVLDVDRRHVAARPAPEPVLGQVVELVRALEQDDVDVLVAQRLGRDLAHRRRPVPRPRAAPAVGPAAGHDGHHVLVVALDERRRPGAVHVPEQDLHAAASRGGRAGAARRSTAARTSGTVTRSTQGWPGTGHSRARQPAHGTSCRRSSCGTRHGRHRTGGTVEGERLDDRGAGGGGQVRRPRVPDDDRATPRPRRPPARRSSSVRPGPARPRPATSAVSARSPGRAGHDHAPPRGRERGDERGMALRRPRPRRDRGTGVHDDVRLAAEGRRRRAAAR